MFPEPEFELAARELGYQLSSVAPRIVRRVYRRPNREFELEFEAFDPKPPAPGTIIISGFAPNSSLLGATQRAAIDRFARKILADMPSKPNTASAFIRFEGHEDETGDPANFSKLGERRALAVFAHFKQHIETVVKRKPNGDYRIVQPVVASAGPNRPIRSNVTAAGRAQNRRVEIRVEWR